jgi:hydroxymethylpyrimidine/phosphomethylpyrimidine kinase
MLYSRDVIHAVAQILNDFSSVPCVVDPVMVSTAGARLLKDDAIECYKNELFAHATIITPNRREAEVLLGRPMNPRNMKADLRALCINGNAVIVKSIGEADSAGCSGSSVAGISRSAANASGSVAYGAAAGSACEGGVLKDYFYDPATDRMRIFSKKYIKTNNRNGTGDTLASAIATYLARGFKLADAVAYSEKFIQKAIAAGANYDFGSGFGGTQPFFRDVARYEREFEKYSSMK